MATVTRSYPSNLSKDINLSIKLNSFIVSQNAQVISTLSGLNLDPILNKNCGLSLFLSARSLTANLKFKLEMLVVVFAKINE